MIYKNGVRYALMYSDLGTNAWSPVHCDVVVQMAANDTIEFYYQGDPDSGGGWHYAGGYLLG